MSTRTVAAPERGSVSDQRFFTLNIGGPSEPRAARLAAFLRDVAADVLVLTETRANHGTRLLLDWCRSSGYVVATQHAMAAGERGVVVASRLPTGSPVSIGPVELMHRLAAVELMVEPRLTVVGAYVPSRDASVIKIARKQSFLREMEACLSSWIERRPLLLLGDFNVITRDHKPRYRVFRSWEYDALENLLAAGMVDVFAKMHPGVQAHSWIGRTGDGYRYDYAFLSPCLAERVTHCEYLHETRHLGISDHAGLLLNLSDVEAASAEVSPVRRRSLEPV